MTRAGWVKVGDVHAYRSTDGRTLAEVQRHPDGPWWVAVPFRDRRSCRRVGWFSDLADARAWVARERRRRR